MTNKRKKGDVPFDFPLFTLVLALSILGIAFIYSAVGTHFALRQGVALLIGAGCLYVMLCIPNEFYQRFWWIFFALNVLLLGATLFLGVGREETGGQSWLVFGPIRFQPAEIVKIGFVISFAAHLDKVKQSINRFSVLLCLLLHAGVVIGLIAAQPDAGTAMVFFFIALAMMFIAGLGYRWLIAGGVLSCAALPFLWLKMQTYQQERIQTFFDPARDPFGAGYQVIQSKTAIANGGLMGHGYLRGVLSQSDALPAKHTDFLFAVVGEELGFIGCALVVGLLFAIILRCFLSGKVSNNSFGTIVCTGIGAMLLFHAVENIGMCIGLTPVTGIPLPFFSYGGTSLITVWMGVGLVMNAHYKT